MSTGVVNPSAGISPTSIVLNYAFCVFAASLLMLFVFAHFIAEPILMPRAYKKIYRDMSPANRRSFTCHHVWLLVKGLCVVGIWPMINIFPRHKATTEPLFNGTGVTNGDMLSVFYMLITSMFIFELVYRTKVSPVSMGHHIAGVLLAIWQVATDIEAATGNADELVIKSCDSQFRLIMVYGAFEICFESYPHIAVILHRLNQGNNMRLSKIWTIAGVFSIVGSLGELAAVAVFMVLNWHLWDHAMKVVQPILHIAFMAAQLHGARIGFRLGFDYRQKAVKAGLIKGNPDRKVPWILRLPFEKSIYRNPHDKPDVPPSAAVASSSDAEKQAPAFAPVLALGSRPAFPSRQETATSTIDEKLEVKA